MIHGLVGGADRKIHCKNQCAKRFYDYREVLLLSSSFMIFK